MEDAADCGNEVLILKQCLCERIFIKWRGTSYILVRVVNEFYQEKMRGQRGRLPVQPLGYVMSTKVIFRRAEVSVLAEVCLPRRPHAGQPRCDV